MFCTRHQLRVASLRRPLGTGTVPAVSSLDIDAAPEIPEELKPEVPKRASAPPQCAGGFFTRKRVPRWFGWYEDVRSALSRSSLELMNSLVGA